MLKKLTARIGEYKKETILAPLLVSMEVVMEVVIPMLMARLIDNGIEKNDLGYIIRIGLILALCAVVSLLFGVGSGTMAARASAGFARNLRKDMYYNVQNFSFSNIDKFSTASIVTRLTTDVTNVQNAFQMFIRTAVRSPIMLIFSLIMTVSIKPSLSAIFLLAIPVLGGGILLISMKAHPYFEKMFKYYDRLNTVVRENLRGIRVVKAFVREEHEKEKFTESSEDIRATASRAQRILAFNNPLMQFSMYTCMLLISWIGANLIVVGEMTTGQLVSLFSYSMQILSSLTQLGMIFVMLTMSRASAERIVEILDEEPDIHDGNKIEVKDGSIRFEDVQFRYRKGGRPVLDKINLDIKSGETVGILGGTGSGKSSLVQLIPRLYDVARGKVTVGGADVREYDLKTLRDAVAMVLQKNVLFSGTIKDNLRWGNANATDEQIVHACKLAQADGFINDFPDGYDTYLEQGGTNVSGGQKQRLCIARALLKNPKVLILDDSTSAVDTRTDALIRQAFKEEIPGVTKIIIAQRVASVQDADQIVVLDGGEISAVGKHDELMKTSPIYREVYESQRKGDNL